MHSYEQVQHIMKDFAVRTGLIGTKSPKRYLWTDAFAVCNFLGMYEAYQETEYLNLAKKLVDQVHEILGHHRSDSQKKGWLSALNQEEGALHPTAGGLRIGKALQERRADEPFDEQKEWDRDGQYYHYLTKWMHALSRMTQVTGEYRYNRWAIELAKVAFAKFSYIDPQTRERRMYWKMSTDLSRPLVASMGQHDALDGWVTYLELASTAHGDTAISKELNLDFEIAELYKMAASMYIPTADPLGIGGLLHDTHLLSSLPVKEEHFLAKMTEASKESLQAFISGENYLNFPAEYRLGFRELGLAIGLKAFEQKSNNPFARYLPLADAIIEFWSKAEHQQNKTWQEHIDINAVMLATALAPRGYLEYKELS